MLFIRYCPINVILKSIIYSKMMNKLNHHNNNFNKYVMNYSRGIVDRASQSKFSATVKVNEIAPYQ